jgi:hypothetical protein
MRHAAKIAPLRRFPFRRVSKWASYVQFSTAGILAEIRRKPPLLNGILTHRS